MKRILLVALMLAGITSSFAQETERNVRRAAIMKTEKMTKELNLSDEQKKAVLQVNMNMADRAKDRELSADQEAQIRQETEARYRVIFSKEQYTKYQEMNRKKADADK